MPRLLHTLVFALTLAAGCSKNTPPPADPGEPAEPPRPPPSAPAAAATAAEEVDDAALALFQERGLDGAFVLLDLKTRGLVVVNPARAGEGYLPASTFKIPNTLVGLETGVIPDASFHLPWDGKVRGIPGAEGQISSIPEWNRDQDLASAMKYSVVWFYQEVARRIGPERMQRHVDAFGYGNRDISGGIDAFWLTGGLRITPREQVEFLRKLHEGELPVSAAHAELVKKLIVLEAGDGLTLRGKTGLTAQGDRGVGWLVGSVDRQGGTVVYATLVLGPASDLRRLMPVRQELTRALLRRRGIPVNERPKP